MVAMTDAPRLDQACHEALFLWALREHRKLGDVLPYRFDPPSVHPEFVASVTGIYRGLSPNVP